MRLLLRDGAMTGGYLDDPATVQAAVREAAYTLIMSGQATAAAWTPGR